MTRKEWLKLLRDFLEQLTEEDLKAFEGYVRKKYPDRFMDKAALPEI